MKLLLSLNKKTLNYHRTVVCLKNTYRETPNKISCLPSTHSEDCLTLKEKSFDVSSILGTVECADSGYDFRLTVLAPKKISSQKNVKDDTKRVTEGLHLILEFKISSSFHIKN